MKPKPGTWQEMPGDTLVAKIEVSDLTDEQLNSILLELSGQRSKMVADVEEQPGGEADTLIRNLLSSVVDEMDARGI